LELGRSRRFVALPRRATLGYRWHSDRRQRLRDQASAICSRLIEERCMPAEIESFADAQRARRLQPSVPLAERYIERAEEALKLLAEMSTEAERRALCQITETWLSLAEASLQPRQPR
jgi:hypothetical protein